MQSVESPVRAVILAGGSGTRLWPRSTDSAPKPFLPLAGPVSLLRQTWERAVRVAGERNVWFSARSSHAALILAELPGLSEERLVLEPDRRNTAPAIALSALAARRTCEDPILVVLPSDQAVADADAFVSALETGIAAASTGEAFVTLGIPPVRPETGFGYLEAGESVAPGVRKVTRFVEKPPIEDARRYAVSGDHLWNAGIFIFRTGLLLREMERLCPDLLASARKADAARAAGDAEGFARAFLQSRAISIDYAVMEKASAVWTVPSACGWSDLGSWEAVFEFRGGGPGRNVLEGPAESSGGDGNLVLASSRPVRVVGLSGVAVVDSPEGILVMKLGSSDALRASVESALAEKKR